MEKTELLQVWKTYSRIPDDMTGLRRTPRARLVTAGKAYQHLLLLMSQRGIMPLTQEDFDQLTEWDMEEINAISDEEKVYQRPIYDWSKEFPEMQENRLEYLRVLITDLEKYLKRCYTYRAEATKRGVAYWDKEKYCAFLFPEFEEVEGKWLKAKKDLYFNEHKAEMSRYGVTDDMIQRAKEYPIENLIEFNRSYMCRCIWHNEKTASLSLNRKTNHVRCFGCDKSDDAIGVCMEIKKMNFVEAIRVLQ